MLKLPSGDLTDLPGKFPDQVDKEARKSKFRDEIFRDRQEVRGFTIDDIDSPDLDDAIWLEQKPEGWHVQVSISDVDTLVRRDSYVDLEAMSRVHTHYFPEHSTEEGKTLPKFSIPMLPRVLSDYRLSLRAGQLRPTMTVDTTLSPDLRLLGAKVQKTYLRSLSRLGLREYSSHKVIGDPGLPLWNYYQLAKALNTKRWAEGRSISFQELKEGIYTDEDGMVQQGSVSVSSLIVQEFMILTNYAVGSILKDNRRVAPFRNHQPSRKAPPTQEQIRKEIDRTDDYLALVDNIRATYNKFLSSAQYEHRPSGHFGIGVPVYLHFTSPIRRYADLVVHRVLKALIDGERPPYSRRDMIELCNYLNKRARRLLTLRSIRSGTHSLHNYNNYSHLLTKERQSKPDFVEKLLEFLKYHRIGNPYFEFTASSGFNIELTCSASVRFQRIRHQVRVTARADKQSVKNEAARLLYRKVREMVKQEIQSQDGLTGQGAKPRALLKKPIMPTLKERPASTSHGNVAVLYQKCESEEYEIPTYHYESWTGGTVLITCICRISELLKVTGIGNSREAARQAAAQRMLVHLGSGQRIPQTSVHPPALAQNDNDDEPDQPNQADFKLTGTAAS